MDIRERIKYGIFRVAVFALATAGFVAAVIGYRDRGEQDGTPFLVGMGICVLLCICAFIAIAQLVREKEKDSDGANKKLLRSSSMMQTYEGIIRMLAAPYERIFYVLPSEDRYREYRGSAKGRELINEGSNFWRSIVEEIISSVKSSERIKLERFLSRENMLSENRKEEVSRLSFCVPVDGEDHYYEAAFRRSVRNEPFSLVLGLRNIDAEIHQEDDELEVKKAADRRLDIYRSALMSSMYGFFEVNISQGFITDGPYITPEGEEPRLAELPELERPFAFDGFATYCIKKYFIEPSREHFDFNTCAHLRREFDAGHRLCEIDFQSAWQGGENRSFRQSFYMTKNEQDGSLIALCAIYDMTEKLSSEKAISDLTEELERSRIRISASQMQPHFLYNVLGSIREIILEDPEYASDMICDFTTHLRACIKSLSNDTVIPFEGELENIRAYVNIERMRFGDRIHIVYDIQDSDFKIVPLCVQPLVENAIRHGIFPRKDGKGTVTIRTVMKNGFHVITVQDNGVGFDYENICREIRENVRDSTGLTNITLRLKKILNAEVDVTSCIGVGTTVNVFIPEE